MEFAQHLDLLQKDLELHWSPLPGLGDPFHRNEMIKAAINQANTRASKWIDCWSPIQEVEHIHRVVEAVGMIANNISSVATPYSHPDLAMPVDMRTALAGDLQECLINVKGCASRVALLTASASTLEESLIFFAQLVSIQVERLGMQSIVWASDFVLLPGSIGVIESETLRKDALQLVSNIASIQGSGIPNSTAAWLKAKIKSLLDLVDSSTPFTYAELARLAHDKPEISTEIAKYALSEFDTLADAGDLLHLLNANFRTLSDRDLWGEQHRRALAAIQIQLPTAILTSSRLNSDGRKAAAEWLAAFHSWSAGYEYTEAKTRDSPSTAHLLTTGESMIRICVTEEGAEMTEIEVSEDFWKTIWSVHETFDDKDDTSTFNAHRKLLSKSLHEILSLPDGADYQLVIHGRAALVPWFCLTMNGKPWAYSCTRASSRPRHRPVESLLSPGGHLAIIDESFGTSARLALQAWKLIAGNKAEVITINSDKESLVGRDEMITRILGADEVMFFGHGQSEMLDYRQAGLLIGRDDWITANDISALDLTGIERLLLIACQTGRTNLGVPVSSMAEAFSARGASNVISTLWSIRPDVGSKFLQNFLEKLGKGLETRTAWAGAIKDDPNNFGAFVLSTPMSSGSNAVGRP